MDPLKLNAIITIASSLVRSGFEILQTLKDKDDISDEDLLALIERENSEQEAAREKLKALIGN